jgi:hypothetical protein
MDNEDDIRRPDKVKREILFDDNRTDYEKQLDEALYVSLQESEEKNKIYEDEIYNNYFTETARRKEAFRELLFDLRKLIKIDKEIKEIYEIIEPIIDAYCSQFINCFELDAETYDKIFNVLGSIRTNKNNIELCKGIIVKTFTS